MQFKERGGGRRDLGRGGGGESQMGKEEYLKMYFSRERVQSRQKGGGGEGRVGIGG